MAYLAGYAAAVVPTDIVNNSQDDWLVANGIDRTLINIKVQNSTYPAYTIVYDVLDSEYGSVGATVLSALPNTVISNEFTVKHKSGTALIRITVQDSAQIEPPYSFVHPQRIDHNSPYAMSYLMYDESVTIGDITYVTIGMVDKYGNAIDDKNFPETIRFMVGSPTGKAGFWTGTEYSDRIVKSVDPTGNVTVTLRVDRIAGENVVYIDPVPADVKDVYITIYGIANAGPFAITQQAKPSALPHPTQPADGRSQFEITYLVKDQYGNPAGNRTITVASNITGEEQELTTNMNGQIILYYGPKNTIGAINITAIAKDNSSVACSQVVEFVPTDPTNMLLTASPQSMPSLDAKPSTFALIRAKVMDMSGNPVQGEHVTFSMLDNTRYVYNETSSPYLLDSTATTDDDGYAVIRFVPGAFNTDTAALNYSSTATGSAVIRASWGSVQRDITLTWKNYPYLSAETEVDKAIVDVNGTIDVTVRVKGDGWALQPTPLDVVLCTDRSGSMLYNATDGILDDRAVHAMTAAKIFNAHMSSQDRVGLVSFADNSDTAGWADLTGSSGHAYSSRRYAGRDNTPSDDSAYVSNHYQGNPKLYSAFATVDLPLNYDRSVVDAIIDGMVPAGGTPLREGLYRSAKLVHESGRPDALKAIILLTDGAWNTGGDPRGERGASSWPSDGIDSRSSVITWIQAKNIKIYTIGLGTEPYHDQLQAYANETGGKYYYAPTADQLSGIYVQIAGDLKTEAGVDTTMDIDMTEIAVTEGILPGYEVFDYQYLSGISTVITSRNETVDPLPATPPYPWSIDQTDEWLENGSLHFEVGTIRLDQTWETTYRLKILKEGNINLFGNKSIIRFNNGTGSLTIPDTFVTAKPAIPPSNVSTLLNVTITDYTKGTVNEPVVDAITINWTVGYSGFKAPVLMDVFYMDDNLSWTPMLSMLGPVEREQYPTNLSTALDVRGRPSGTYYIKIIAKADDHPDMEDIVGPIVVGPRQNYIRIQ